MVNGRPFARYVSIHFLAVLFVKPKDVLKQLHRQGRLGFVQHRSGLPKFVIEDHMIQTDTVTRYHDLAVGPFIQIRW